MAPENLRKSKVPVVILRLVIPLRATSCSARIPLGRPLRFNNLTRGCAPSSNPARFNPLIRPTIFLFICRENLGPRVSFPRVFDPGEEYTLTFYLLFFSQTHPWPPIQTVRSNFFTVKRLRDEAFNIKQVYLRRLRVVGSNFW